MKNILISVLTVVLLVLIVVVMVRGIHIGSLAILSIPEIISENDDLNRRVEELNTLNNVTYKKKLSDLTVATKTLSASKTQYLDLASISTEAEIKEANQDKTYAKEFLWSQIGNHATKEGVNLRVEVVYTTANISRLDFTATGSYMAIRNFVYSLENDTDLNFRIENFKLTGSGEEITATFTVTDIAIKIENTTESVTNGDSLEINSNNTKKTTTESNRTNNDTVNTIVDKLQPEESISDRIDEAVGGTANNNTTENGN